MDLRAKGYIGGNAVYNTLKRYIDQLYNFKGTKYGSEVVREGDIKKKILEIGIPKDATPSQVRQMNKAVEYGVSKNITVNIRAVKWYEKG